MSDVPLWSVSPCASGFMGAQRSRQSAGGGDRTHPGNAGKSGRHGAQYLTQFVRQHILLDVQGAVLALVVRI